MNTTSPAETEQLGREFGATLKPGDVVFLEGELGAGKTTFVRGLAAARGVRSGVKSPTFALMHRYRGDPDIVHIDLYRQAEDSGLDDLALEEWQGDVITVIEWPKSFAREEWPEAIVVRFEHLDENRRRIRIFRTGAN
ncbi:MAG: tRNA (adenosine(37)-N6)-threonylcarbamoyltransferase complex ATPase subunit type 1 TsaE [Planctomycetota bacterium]|jgi:tRNA threonylcarbamoyladenosine biosynthesis protein TsaE